ncbi:hypothetical protein [Cyanobium gracile]|uniref:Uncharacterized protein n=1 Tax=Cyanobium gracile UHCC 0281 TaxID=3110309 RepID=A0ABU5SZM0_9CYAN|nr:hypothetical protein [Cyanobium gracile]MEA5443965.1 hypothetical protein [Cyanobium gracile UHCC 0281]
MIGSIGPAGVQLPDQGFLGAEVAVGDVEATAIGPVLLQVEGAIGAPGEVVGVAQARGGVGEAIGVVDHPQAAGTGAGQAAIVAEGLGEAQGVDVAIQVATGEILRARGDEGRLLAVEGVDLAILDAAELQGAGSAPLASARPLRSRKPPAVFSPTQSRRGALASSRSSTATALALPVSIAVADSQVPLPKAFT